MRPTESLKKYPKLMKFYQMVSIRLLKHHTKRHSTGSFDIYFSTLIEAKPPCIYVIINFLLWLAKKGNMLLMQGAVDVIVYDSWYLGRYIINVDMVLLVVFFVLWIFKFPFVLLKTPGSPGNSGHWSYLRLYTEKPCMIVDCKRCCFIVG